MTAPTALTVQPVPGPYVVSPAALALALTFAACDATNGNSFAATGKEELLLHNTDSSAATVTISSVPDALGRSSDIAAYSIPAAGFAMYSFSQLPGWQQVDGTIKFTASSALVFAAVLRHA